MRASGDNPSARGGGHIAFRPTNSSPGCCRRRRRSRSGKYMYPRSKQQRRQTTTVSRSVAANSRPGTALAHRIHIATRATTPRPGYPRRNTPKSHGDSSHQPSKRGDRGGATSWPLAAPAPAVVAVLSLTTHCARPPTHLPWLASAPSHSRRLHSLTIIDAVTPWLLSLSRFLINKSLSQC